MNGIVNFLGQIPFITGLWIFYALVVLHELEEWNIDRFEREHFEGLPEAATDRSARMVIAFVSIAGLVWVSIATLSGHASQAAWIFLPAMAFMLLNALQHIYWSFLFQKPAPGVISAALLILPAGGYLAALAVSRGYVPVWYAVAQALLALFAFTGTVVSGKRMPALIRSGNLIGIWLAERKG